LQLPFELRNQIIQCIGYCFHYKTNVEDFFVSCGVERKLASKHKEFPKFDWTRKLLNELDTMENGSLIQRHIVTALCELKGLPDDNAPNPTEGLSALRKLRELAVGYKSKSEEEKERINQRKLKAEEKIKVAQNRTKTLDELKKAFVSLISSSNRQKAGYLLEDILKKSFTLFGFEYRGSYKIPTQQIDGHFRFEGFDYLVEARWTSSKPSSSEIAAFKHKVDTKLESTRGVFISINGFADEVVKAFENKGSNILFFTGEDISHIFEGSIDLDVVMRTKVKKAAQEGKLNYPVKNML
jgi:hypothetical protein